MKRRYCRIVITMLLMCILPCPVQAAQLLIPGGQVIGIQLKNDALTVAAFDDALGSQAKAAGLRVGDEILAVNSHPVAGAADIRNALAAAGETAELTIRRNGSRKQLRLCPRNTEEGPRLGIYLKQGITGIGTVTWYDPATNIFGALGHGVSDTSGQLAAMASGTAYPAQVTSVKRGTCGEPGQLKGSADPQNLCGTLYRNTPQGIFGINPRGWAGTPLPVAGYDEVHAGDAVIRSTIAGARVQEYSVEILKIYPREHGDGRNFLLKVTDPALLSTTGGIVQGMSGSPVLQDGKIIGAVTHVLVNDPTTGYGIFIENMLDATS